MPSPRELIAEEGSPCVAGVKGGREAARRIEDHAGARDALELMHLGDDRIAPGSGVGS
jgi:hypothetical protein